MDKTLLGLSIILFLLGAAFAVMGNYIMTVLCYLNGIAFYYHGRK